MSTAQIPATLIVDDPPANATYFARLQQLAFGFTPADRGGWGTNWRALEPAAWFRPEDARAFTDVCQEFGVRGKFTCLPCPAGLGRIDQSVRGYADRDLQQFVSILRDRLAGSFDITPEVLTHSMALNPADMSLLPHAETAWVAHLCLTGQFDELKAYLRVGFQILRSAGLTPRGLTVGGMNDVSDITAGRMWDWESWTPTLARALLEVEREFAPGLRTTFIHLGLPPRDDRSRELCAPSLLYQSPDGGRVYTPHLINDDAFFPLLHGPGPGGERLASTIDALITPDLSDGLLIRQADSGKAIVFAAHAQTLNALNTNAGTTALREVLSRLRARYGPRLLWLTTAELCAHYAEPQ